MPTLLFPTVGGDPFLPAAELDVGISETQEDAVTWSSVPVEGTGNVAEHAALEPRRWTFAGRIGAEDPARVRPRDIERLNRAHDALIKLKDARQLVTVVGQTFVANAGIVRVSATRDQTTGDTLSIEIELQEISLPVPTTTTIPASRLRASVRRRGAPGKAGGAGPGKDVTKTPDGSKIGESSITTGGGYSGASVQ